MDKVKFIGLVIGGVIVAYLFLTVNMPLLVEVSGDAAAVIEASPSAGSYVGGAEGARYTPLALYFVPAILGIVLIVYKLRQKA